MRTHLPLHQSAVVTSSYGRSPRTAVSAVSAPCTGVLCRAPLVLLHLANEMRAGYPLSLMSFRRSQRSFVLKNLTVRFVPCGWMFRGLSAGGG